MIDGMAEAKVSFRNGARAWARARAMVRAIVGGGGGGLSTRGGTLYPPTPAL